MLFFPPLPVSNPGGGFGRNGAEEHRGVLPAVEGDWLRGQRGQLLVLRTADRSQHSLPLSLSHSFALCVSASPKAKTTQKKDGSKERVKA